MLNELKDFEIFVERMEKFVNDVKSDPIFIRLDPEFKNYDLRSPSLNMPDNEIFPLPTKLQDYFTMWQHICEKAEEYKNEKSLGISGMRLADWVFFDLYWNDTNENNAYYQEECFSLWFTDDGITYEKPEY